MSWSSLNRRAISVPLTPVKTGISRSLADSQPRSSGHMRAPEGSDSQADSSSWRRWAGGWRHAGGSVGGLPKLIAPPSSPARYRPAAMSLRASFGVIQNCRVSHPCCVVPASVPGGRREGRQALLAGRFLCSSATARQPDPSTRLGPTAGCGPRGHVCGAARSCRRPGSPGAVLTRRGRSRRGGGGVPGRRWTGP